MPKTASIKITMAHAESAPAGTWLWDGGDGGLKGFGLRVTAGGAKTFLVRYRLQSGEQKYARIGSFPALTVDQARKQAKLALAIAERGGNPSGDRRALREAPTLADLAEEYLGPYASSRGLKRRTVKDARTVLAPLLKGLGRRKVIEVTTTDIRRAHGEARTRSPRPNGLGMRAGAAITAPTSADTPATGSPATLVSPYQANRLLAVLSKMFSLAIERGWRTDNPCRGVRKFPEDQRWRHLGGKEVGRLLIACDGYENQNAADAVRLLLFTGARLQEVLKAEWCQFDLDAGVWEKPSAHTKQQRQHWLELEGPALEVLRSMHERGTHAAYLFPGAPNVAGQVTSARADLKRPWTSICKSAGLTNVRLHDLRRTTASFMIDGQASLATVGKALGHTQASTTQRYAQMSQSVQRDALRDAGERMAALKAAALQE